MAVVNGQRITTNQTGVNQDIRDVDSLIYNPEKFDNSMCPLSAKLATRQVKNFKYERFEEAKLAREGYDAAGTAKNATSMTVDASLAASIIPGMTLFVPLSQETILVTAKAGTTLTVVRNLGGGITGTDGSAEGQGVAISMNDKLVIAGVGLPEGTTFTDSISTTPQSSYNYVQTFKWGLEMSKTAQAMALYGESSTFEYRFKQAVEYYKWLVEHAMWFGKRAARTNVATGKPERFTAGVMQCLKANVTSVTAGTLTMKIFDAFGEKIFENGSKTKYMFGSITLGNVLNQIARNSIRTMQKDTQLGCEIMEIKVAGGTIKYVPTPKIFFGGAAGTGRFAPVLDLDSDTIKKAVLRPTEILQDAGDDRTSGKYSYLESEMGLDMFGWGLDNDFAASTGAQRGVHGLLYAASGYDFNSAT